MTLRSIKWEDLDDVLHFANSLIDDREVNPDFGIIFDKRPTRESEAEWLGAKLAKIESGTLINVIAEVDRKLVGNSEVERGSTSDEFHHGKLGISIINEYRNQGIGVEMMKTLIDESKKAGLKTIELEVFASNQVAIRTYDRAGFKQVGRIPRKIFRKGCFTDIIVMAIEL